MWFDIKQIAGAAVVALGFLAGPAAAQAAGIDGVWRTARRSGVYDITLTQDGRRVTGTYHLGSIEGTFDGPVLSGTFSDITARGRFQVTFSPDGARFDGMAQTQNGPDHWTGQRIVGPVETAPMPNRPRDPCPQRGINGRCLGPYRN